MYYIIKVILDELIHLTKIAKFVHNACLNGEPKQENAEAMSLLQEMLT